jgi:hypothetical protein
MRDLQILGKVSNDAITKQNKEIRTNQRIRKQLTFYVHDPNPEKTSLLRSDPWPMHVELGHEQHGHYTPK